VIVATHIMGLTALESGMLASSSRSAAEKAAICEQIARRYQAITASGELLARKYQPGRGARRDLASDPGRSFAYDDIAGDNVFIFLEVPSRYFPSAVLPPAALYGWQFDAARLVMAGAVVQVGDLASAYTDLIYQACVEVAATLPRLEMITDDELAGLDEGNAALLAAMRSDSTDPTDALHDLVRGYPSSDPVPGEAVEQTRRLIVERISALQRRERKTGAHALALLNSGQHCEILVRGQLSLARAIARIEQGVIYGQ